MPTNGLPMLAAQQKGTESDEGGSDQRAGISGKQTVGRRKSKKQVKNRITIWQTREGKRRDDCHEEVDHDFEKYCRAYPSTLLTETQVTTVSFPRKRRNGANS